MMRGGGNKVPGRDGIGKTFFCETWGKFKEDWIELFTEMLEHPTLTTHQKQGVIVCLPKTNNPKETSDYET
jgi:hypothetical protein